MNAFKSSYRFSYFLLLVGASLMLIAMTPSLHNRLQISKTGNILEKKLLPATLYVGTSVPAALHEEAARWSMPSTDDPHKASVTLDVTPLDEADSIWVYALVVPFPTLIDNISSQDLLDFWHGAGPGPFDGSPLRMAESTLRAVSATWGEPASGVVMIVSAEQLVEELWAETPSWGIVPFEELEPRLKVLSIDQNSPIHHDFDQGSYPILAGFRSSDPAFILPPTNRDPQKLTTVMMTGVTALVRATASKMERNGMTYPAQDIREVLLEPDILHINNEVPFYSLCDVPDPFQVGLIFCSREKYMELLTHIDMDVVELSGDHFADYGAQAMLETLQIYADAGIPYYGGGANLEEARKPLLLEDHGNKIAFIGCNDKKAYASAEVNTPGAASCDYGYMRQQIKSLRQQGYVVIATFQYEEYTDAWATPIQMQEFRWQADSGAQIVSGSQAHYAQVMEFYGESFIHYGLGNLFFDQMGRTDGGIDNIRRLFADEHVIYDGKYISTRIHTFILMDYARPRLTDAAERDKFLRYYFEQSGWAVSPPLDPSLDDE
jgi:hypothetical protein